MDQNFAARRDRLREVLPALEVEAALVSCLVNVRYLTGFTGSNAALLLTADDAVLCTDGRYQDQAREESPDVELLVARPCPEALLDRADRGGIRAVAFEADEVSVSQYDGFVSAHPGLRLRPLDRAVERLRRVKDAAEIELIREACAIGDRALAELVKNVRPGRTERELAHELENRMFDHGADGLAFETIVAGGPNSAIPHHQPGHRQLERGDLLKIDFGALYQGYHADCTRTFMVGAEPADWQREIFQVVREAQRAGREALAPGVELAAVDAAARDVVRAAGYGENFTHGLGHGVGLVIHEDPFFADTSTGTLDDRTPVTVEPGVYLVGRGGVRIEDTLVVRAEGPELLTVTPKDLIVI